MLSGRVSVNSFAGGLALVVHLDHQAPVVAVYVQTHILMLDAIVALRAEIDGIFVNCHIFHLCTELHACSMVLLVRAVNATRFIQSAHFSRLLQHVTETVDSLTMVRVFGMTQRFYERFCRLADQNLRVSLASVTCSRLARTFAMGCSQFMVLTTLVFTVAIGGDVNEYEDTSRSSSIGLALNSSLSCRS
ncbi:hypothetical protein HPB50_022964 [Hyalomma asiaticum]|uniref:Uncharacterized protein n=1 Tax=Hyalomma asiaticum TaxID=266040 RepID=A0ACB7RJM5_HYAAI|nr:hypothetical protein HPB50_022964 [Hyalomma asiaticum]